MTTSNITEQGVAVHQNVFERLLTRCFGSDFKSTDIDGILINSPFSGTAGVRVARHMDELRLVFFHHRDQPLLTFGRNTPKPYLNGAHGEYIYWVTEFCLPLNFTGPEGCHPPSDLALAVAPPCPEGDFYSVLKDVSAAAKRPFDALWKDGARFVVVPQSGKLHAQPVADGSTELANAVKKGVSALRRTMSVVLTAQTAAKEAKMKAYNTKHTSEDARKNAKMAAAGAAAEAAGAAADARLLGWNLFWAAMRLALAAASSGEASQLPLCLTYEKQFNLVDNMIFHAADNYRTHCYFEQLMGIILGITEKHGVNTQLEGVLQADQWPCAKKLRNTIAHRGVGNKSHPIFQGDGWQGCILEHMGKTFPAFNYPLVLLVSWLGDHITDDTAPVKAVLEAVGWSDKDGNAVAKAHELFEERVKWVRKKTLSQPQICKILAATACFDETPSVLLFVAWQVLNGVIPPCLEGWDSMETDVKAAIADSTDITSLLKSLKKLKHERPGTAVGGVCKLLQSAVYQIALDSYRNKGCNLQAHIKSVETVMVAVNDVLKGKITGDTLNWKSNDGGFVFGGHIKNAARDVVEGDDFYGKCAADLVKFGGVRSIQLLLLVLTKLLSLESTQPCHTPSPMSSGSADSDYDSSLPPPSLNNPTPSLTTIRRSTGSSSSSKEQLRQELAKERAAAKKQAEEWAAAKKQAEERAAYAEKQAEERAAAKKRAEERAAYAEKQAEERAAYAEKQAEERAAHAEKLAEERAAHAEKLAEERAAHAEKLAEERVERKRAEERAAYAEKQAEERAAYAEKLAEERAGRKRVDVWLICAACVAACALILFWAIYKH